MAHPDTLIGAKIDNYTVVRHLARGGMADVYLAQNVRLQRDVVLKILLPSFVENMAFVERFRREAQAMARLQHNGIVQVYDTGDTPDGRPFIAMQYVRGGTLEELLEKLEREGQMMSPPFALAIARQVTGALGVAHAAGIVHRDLKPSNILLDEQRRPLLTDLGIAYVQDTQRLTRTDTFIGTPHYMSPEQGKGHELDARSDIYSLGVVLFEMLSGQRPFPGDSHFALIHAHTSLPAPVLSRIRPGLPRSIDRLVGRCLEKVPSRRYQSAAELAAAIDRALAELGAAGALTASGEWQWRPQQSGELFLSREGRTKPLPAGDGRRGNGLLWSGIGALAVLLIIGYLLFGRTDPPATVTPTLQSVAVDTPPTATDAPTRAPTSTVAPTAGGIIATGAETDAPAAETDTPASATTPTQAPTTPAPSQTPAPPVVSGAVQAVALRDVFTRNGPGTLFAIDGDLSRDEPVTVLGRDLRGDWYLVQPRNGAAVWISAGFLSATAGSLDDVTPAATIPVPPTPTRTPIPPTDTPAPSNGGSENGGDPATPTETRIVVPIVPTVPD